MIYDETTGPTALRITSVHHKGLIIPQPAST